MLIKFKLRLIPKFLAFDRELALGRRNDFVVVVAAVVVLCHHLVKFTYECLLNAWNGLNCASKYNKVAKKVPLAKFH